MTRASLRPDTSIEPFYPDSDGTPMAESDSARDSLIYAVEALKLHFQHRPDVYVSGNLFIYYEQGVRDAVLSPDTFVVFGVENRRRRSYKVWEENGRTPDFVLEITSETTRHTDRVDKVRDYAKLNVAEYFQYDPTGDYLEPALQGLRLTDSGYQPMTGSGENGDRLILFSDVLGLELRSEAGGLRFYDPETGKTLLSYQEAEQARRDAERAQQDAETERQAERQARLDAIARLLALGLSAAEVATALALPLEVVEQSRDAPER